MRRSTPRASSAREACSEAFVTALWAAALHACAADPPRLERLEPAVDIVLRGERRPHLEPAPHVAVHADHDRNDLCPVVIRHAEVSRGRSTPGTIDVYNGLFSLRSHAEFHCA